MTDYEKLSKYRGDKSIGQFLADIVREKIMALESSRECPR